MKPKPPPVLAFFALLALPAFAQPTPEDALAAREAAVKAQIAKLDEGDLPSRDAAEHALHVVGDSAVPFFEAALKTAGPDKSERLKRLVRWYGPWSETVEKDARAWYASTLGEGWNVREFKSLGSLDNDLTSGVHERFRFFTASAEKPQDGRHNIVKVGRDGVCEIWTATVPQLRALLDDSRILAIGDDGTRRAALVAQAMMPGAWMADTFGQAEAERIEVLGRTATYHQHSMTLLSGRLGFYVEAQVFTFDEEGHLTDRTGTGAELDFELMHKILEEDAWVQLGGFVPEEYEANSKVLRAKRTFPPPSMLPAK